MASDITALKMALRDRARDVCQMLYPGGKVEGGEFVYDPGTGKIKVQLRGAKTGLWSHFGGEDVGGDLIDLWRHAKGQTIVEALDDIRGYLGIERPRFHTAQQREWRRPKKPQCGAPKAKAKDYLCEDRNLPSEILDRYRVGERGDVIVFPFLRDGELVMAKERLAEDGAKPKPTESGCEKILFGWQAIDDNAREIIITEGEIDALSMAAYGYPALSVPFGGGGGNKQDWIESEFDRLQRFETIYLCMDTDAEGQKAAAEIANRLGLHRCRIVKLPRKDANECLVDGVAPDDIARCLAEADSLDPDGLRKPTDFAEAVTRLFYPPDGQLEGYGLPFAEVSSKLRFRPGEVSLWGGASGSGKSQFLSFAQVHWIDSGSRLCAVSLEMRSSQTLKRMVKQALNVDRPTEEAINAALAWMNDRLLIYDATGKVTLDRLLEVFDYARAKYGCDQFVIDSLMRLGLAADDYAGQENLMFRLVDWALSSGVHVHLVAHTRKGDRQSPSIPDGEDIKGAMEVGANAANILVLWRNRKREEAEVEGPPSDAKAKEKFDRLMAQPGVTVNVAKQRNGDWESKFGLWFNRETYQYRGRGDDTMGRNYIPDPALEEVA